MHSELESALEPQENDRPKTRGKLYTYEELAGLLDVSRRTISREKLKGKLDFIITTHSVRFPEKAVKDYLFKNYHGSSYSVFNNGSEREQNLLSEESLSKFLSVSPTTLGRERDEGNIAYVLIHCQVRYRVADVHAYLERNSANHLPFNEDWRIETEQPLYTIKLLSKRLGVSERTISRACDEGNLNYINVRHNKRFRNIDVESYVANMPHSSTFQVEKKRI